MKFREKLGLAIMIMSANMVTSEGVAGGIGVLFFFVGWVLFALP